MFAQVESFFRRWRRRLSRSEWAIRHLGLTPVEGASEEPGLLLIQVDGLARTQLERAIARGRMPFLRRLLRREGYQMHSFYPGLPSTTPAVQAELYYGVRTGVPAFSFYDRIKHRLGAMYYSDWAKDFEATYAAQAEGLLKGGSSWSNIYTGGASQAESHFCAASLGFGDMWRNGKIRYVLLLVALHLFAALRIAGLVVVEFFVAVWDVIAGVANGEKFGVEIQMAVSRILIAIGVRELITIGAGVDVTRGLPIVHVNFLGYDEHSHRRGPSSAFAHWTLRGIDRSIRQLYLAAHRSPRRDYAVWIFSDHGQERAEPLIAKIPGGAEEVIRRCLDLAQQDPAWRARSQRRRPPGWHSRGRRAEQRLARRRIEDALTPAEEATFTVTSMGPVGHVYFNRPLDDAARRLLARRLIETGEVPGVLLRAADATVTWFHAGGTTAVPDEVEPLLPHPKPLRRDIARDLAALAAHPDAGDLVLLGWSPDRAPRTFAVEHGAHGGPGLEETRGFVLLPAHTRLPAGAENFIRPAMLRAAALRLLGRGRLELPKPVPVSGEHLTLRVMTYNTHGCAGMDGRVSPRRIARVIARHAPDLVALQEVDLGRRRSRDEDQAALIAHELEMNVVFCPTITTGNEHYGHALLSRWPIEVVKRARLPWAKGGWFHEPRCACWARVQVGVRRINFLTAHLGLGTTERVLQMQALLGDEWLGAVPAGEDVILCGDFNSIPGSTPYRLASARLRDVQKGMSGHRPIRTFSSTQPFARLDHIFVTPGLHPVRVLVPRSGLTRVASDHLPLVAELSTAPAGVGTSTRTPA